MRQNHNNVEADSGLIEGRGDIGDGGTVIAPLRLILPLIAVAVGLSGCASHDTSAFIGLVKDAAKDPRCGHTDRISGNIGGINPAGVNVFFERQCPTPVAGIAVTPANVAAAKAVAEGQNP